MTPLLPARAEPPATLARHGVVQVDVGPKELSSLMPKGRSMPARGRSAGDRSAVALAATVKTNGKRVPAPDRKRFPF